jgi:hypothetical protein
MNGSGEYFKTHNIHYINSLYVLNLSYPSCDINEYERLNRQHQETLDHCHITVVLNLETNKTFLSITFYKLMQNGLCLYWIALLIHRFLIQYYYRKKAKLPLFILDSSILF